MAEENQVMTEPQREAAQAQQITKEPQQIMKEPTTSNNKEPEESRSW